MQDNYKSFTNEDLVAMYQRSQREEYLQEIISQNKGLMVMWVTQYNNIPYADMDDLMEECYIACWKAVKAYDPARGVSFSTCLKGYVTQSLNRLYTEATRKKRYTGAEHISYEELAEINKEGGSEKDNSFTIECAEYSVIEVKEFLDSISGTVKEIAVRLYGGMSKKEVATDLQITPATVTYHLHRLQSAYLAFFGEV